MTTSGNIKLLDQPMHGFLCSRCTKSSIILPCLDWAVEQRHSRVPVISTFHSEMEKAVLDTLIAGTCPIIIVLGRTMYKNIPPKLKPLLDNGRLLIISLSDQKRISRESALECNAFICKNATALTFGFLYPESSLYPLYRSLSDTNKPVTVVEMLK